MINTAKCLYCGLVLSEPCRTADAADDCTRKPCEPEEPEFSFDPRLPEWIGPAQVEFNPQRYRK